jgi:peroxiredoxin
MYKCKIISFLLSLGLFFSLHAEEMKPIKITCQISNPVDTVVLFSYLKGIYQPRYVDIEKKIDASRKVSFSIAAEQPMSIKVIHDFRYFEVFCEPGDSIHLAFNAEIYPTEVAFSGNNNAAVTANELLHEFRQAFLAYSNKVISNKIKIKSGLAFRKYMDDIYTNKWKYIAAIPKKEKRDFTPIFNQYLAAEINYWYAYYLMLYRQEHSSLVAAENVYLPDAYYDFLNEILINDDDAFVHSMYPKFIQLYADFRKQYPDFPHGLAARQVLGFTSKESVPLYQSVECLAQIDTLSTKTKLIVLDKLSYGMSAKEALPLAYRLKVKTQDGHFGWVKSQDIKIEPTVKRINAKLLFINNLDIDYEKEFVDCKVTFDSLDIYLDPSDTKPYVSIVKGEDLAILNDETVAKVGFNKNGEYISSPFAKVRTKYGILGWASIAGIKLFFERRSAKEWASKIASISNTAYLGLDYFFYGKTLQYVYGLELREKLVFNGREKVANHFKAFENDCSYADLKAEIAAIYLNEDKKFTLDTAAMQINQDVVDQRTTNLNKRTNQFVLAHDESTITNNTVSIAKGKIVENNNKKGKKNSKAPILIEPEFPEVKYEYKNIIFKGNSKLINKYQLVINLYPDLINNVKKTQPFDIAQGKRFWIQDTFIYKVQVVEPIRGSIKTKNDSFAIWLEPNQNYKIVEEKGKIKVIGDGTPVFDYLKEFPDFDKKVMVDVNAQKTLGPREFKIFIKTQVQKRKEYIVDFNTKRKLTEKFYRLMLLDNNYWAANRLLDYTIVHPELTTDSLYLDFIKDINIQNDRALQSPEYQLFIQKFLNQQIIINRLLNLDNSEVARFTYSGRALKYWQATKIRETLNELGIEEKVLEDIQKFTDDNTYPLLNESLKTIFQNVTMKKEGFRSPSFQLYNLANEKISSSDFKGKVMLVHFWSAKRKGYKKELKALSSIEKKIHSPALVILKVNTDKEYATWKKAFRFKFGKKDKFHVFANDVNTYSQNFNDFFGNNQQHGKVVIDKKGYMTTFRENFIENELLDLIKKELKKR